MATETRGVNGSDQARLFREISYGTLSGDIKLVDGRMVNISANACDENVTPDIVCHYLNLMPHGDMQDPVGQLLRAGVKFVIRNEVEGKDIAYALRDD